MTGPLKTISEDMMVIV